MGTASSNQDQPNVSPDAPATTDEAGPFNSRCQTDSCQWMKVVRSDVIQSGTDGYGQNSKLFKIWIDNGSSPTTAEDGYTDAAKLMPLIKWHRKSAVLYVLCSHAMPVVMSNWGGKRGWVTDAIDFVSDTSNPLASSASIWSKVCIGDPSAWTKSSFATDNGITFTQPADREIEFASPMDAWNGTYVGSSKPNDQPVVPAQAESTSTAAPQPSSSPTSPPNCDDIENQVTQMIKERLSVNVLEFDNTLNTTGSRIPFVDQNYELYCEANVLTDKGRVTIFYGLLITKQNKALVEFQVRNN